jgi:hypothetical protein
VQRRKAAKERTETRIETGRKIWMGDGPLFSFLILSSYFLLPTFFFLLSSLRLRAFAPLRFFLPAFFSSRVFFFPRFFFFAAASGAITVAWNFWCIIASLRCPY